MASLIHISEQEAAQNFAAVMRRVRAGEQIVVEESGQPTVLLSVVEPQHTEPLRPDNRALDTPDKLQGKSASQILQALDLWEAEHGILTIDADFAADVDEAHTRLNHPLDSSRWD